jgi:microfibrillar-associated protein 1
VRARLSVSVTYWFSFEIRTARDTLKERDQLAFDTEEAEKKREAAAEERKRQSRSMVGETVKRGMAESK